ncbi:MAG: flagellar basal body rod protein FlgC [Ignavibacteriaceae bacterium]
MKIANNFPGFNISATGLSIQRKKMNIIAENIANADVRNANGIPYKRKFLTVIQKQDPFQFQGIPPQSRLQLNTTNKDHIAMSPQISANNFSDDDSSLISKQLQDNTPGEITYDPDNPYANEKGYVENSNVNIINEMVQMIAATRSYEANLTALNSSKQMAKDSLEI